MSFSVYLLIFSFVDRNVILQSILVIHVAFNDLWSKKIGLNTVYTENHFLSAEMEMNPVNGLFRVQIVKMNIAVIGEKLTGILIHVNIDNSRDPICPSVLLITRWVSFENIHTKLAIWNGKSFPRSNSISINLDQSIWAFLLTWIFFSMLILWSQIIFVGDSTNRGLMHYLVEKLNSTLTDGSKTHDMKIYRYLNDGKTLVAFDYYPKFWMPTSKRLTFDQTVARLIRR